MRRAIDEMNLREITIIYGLTEASPGITQTSRDDSFARRTQTVGRVLPEMEVKIVDPATRAQLAANEPGELCVRGYNVMAGYYNNPEATRAAIDSEGWLRTGDQATIDEEGYVRITGRIKDIIIRGGENIAPKEVEDLLRTHPAGTVTLCPTGPLTNIARAMQKAPAAVGRIKEIVLMGGAIGEGNITPAAEFNIYVDPHAAAIVFESGVPLVMHGLDVTHQALVTPERLAAIRRLGTPLSRTVVALLEFYSLYDQTRRGRVGVPLHDPCVIAYLLRPALFRGRACHVAIETRGEHTLGRTVVDWSGRTPKAANAMVINEIDADGLFALLTERLARLPLR